MGSVILLGLSLRASKSSPKIGLCPFLDLALRPSCWGVKMTWAMLLQGSKSDMGTFLQKRLFLKNFLFHSLCAIPLSTSPPASYLPSMLCKSSYILLGLEECKQNAECPHYSCTDPLCLWEDQTDFFLTSWRESNTWASAPMNSRTTAQAILAFLNWEKFSFLPLCRTAE